ncbi:MAG TPA: IMP cyclohydrolase [Candidatus Paceibacterota bacterium]|nr:IMP cyclohydrolase [Candidatus Paceibacterota bacterium]
MSNEHIAQENLRALASNPYPGRGFVLGLSEDGESFFQVYWIMGRSESSRNRVFECGMEQPLSFSGPRVSTRAADPSKVQEKDRHLIIYDAMLEAPGLFVVSNGAQTNAVRDAMKDGAFLMDSLKDWQYEPDAPNHTPRITGVIDLRPGGEAEIAVLLKTPDGDGCVRMRYPLGLQPGFGYCVTTYETDGNPLPSFRKPPYIMPIRGLVHDILDTYWSALDKVNRVAIVVKQIWREPKSSTIAIENKHRLPG